ncbi:Uncharacterised protein [Staphylococcus aureus]|nr:Uncharacterised protein [Staphylococcus aureus]
MPMNAPITAITANTGQETLVKAPANKPNALLTNPVILVKSSILLTTFNKVILNTLLNTLLTAAIGAIKAQNTPPKIPITPII